MTNDLALHLKVLRRNAGLRQQDLAHLLDVLPPRVFSIEAGNVTPRIEELTVLALVYGRSTDALLAGYFSDAYRGLSDRLGTLPKTPPNWLKHSNRQHTLNALAGRLEAFSNSDNGGWA